jgi:hypothetical protein
MTIFFSNSKPTRDPRQTNSSNPSGVNLFSRRKIKAGKERQDTRQQKKKLTVHRVDTGERQLQLNRKPGERQLQLNRKPGEWQLQLNRKPGERQLQLNRKPGERQLQLNRKPGERQLQLNRKPGGRQLQLNRKLNKQQSVSRGELKNTEDRVQLSIRAVGGEGRNVLHPECHPIPYVVHYF